MRTRETDHALREGRTALIKALAACEGGLVMSGVDAFDAYGFALIAAVHLAKIPGAKDRLIAALHAQAATKSQHAIVEQLEQAEPDE